MLASWRRTRLQDSVPQRLAEAYSEAAVSITITSLTDMISFFIGIITPFPSVQIFCIYTGIHCLYTNCAIKFPAVTSQSYKMLLVMFELIACNSVELLKYRKPE